MRRDRKEPLYRKEKKTGLQTRYYVTTGGEARWDRNTKAAKKDAETEVSFQPIKGRKNKRQRTDNRAHNSTRAIGGDGLGRDYTPLFRFLLSRVGRKWDEVFSEAKSRLDQEAPIWWMVHNPEWPEDIHNDSSRAIVRIGEGSYWSALTINEEGILVKIDPEANAPTWFGCGCHTGSFNGVPYKHSHEHNRKWNEDRSFGVPNKDKKAQED